MNTINNWVITATIMDDERRQWWIDVFESPTVPILSMVPTLVNVPGYERVESYFLDVDAITDERKEKLLHALAKKFDMSMDEARLEFERGVPILAVDVVVSSRAQSLLFGVMDDYLFHGEDEPEKDDDLYLDSLED